MGAHSRGTDVVSSDRNGASGFLDQGVVIHRDNGDSRAGHSALYEAIAGDNRLDVLGRHPPVDLPLRNTKAIFVRNEEDRAVVKWCLLGVVIERINARLRIERDIWHAPVTRMPVVNPCT